MTIVYLLIYWAVAAFVLLMSEIFNVENRKITWKDWVPTLILAPLIFPFYMIMWRHGEASLGVDFKNKTAGKKKNEKK